jgi:hypothetical protein
VAIILSSRDHFVYLQTNTLSLFSIHTLSLSNIERERDTHTRTHAFTRVSEMVICFSKLTNSQDRAMGVKASSLSIRDKSSLINNVKIEKKTKYYTERFTDLGKLNLPVVVQL